MPARLLRVIARVLAGLLLAVLGLAVGLGVYLQEVGFPESAARHLRAAARDRGFLLEFGRLRLDLPRGLVLEDLRLVSGPGAAHVRIGADSITILTRLTPWRSEERVRVEGVDVRGIRLAVEGAESAEAVRAPAGIEGPLLRVRYEPSGLYAELREARILGLNVDLAGRVSGIPPETLAWPGKARAPGREMPELPPGWIEEISRGVQRMADIDWVHPPRIRVRFSADLDDPTALSVRGHMDGGAGSWKGVRFQDLGSALTWMDGRLTLHGAEATLEDGWLRAEAEWTPAEDRITASAEGEAPWIVCRRVLPSAVLEALDEIRVESSGRLAGRWAVENAARADLGRIASGWLRASGLSINDMPIERAALSYAWVRPRLRFTDVVARVGLGRGGGPVEGDVELDLERRHVSARARGSFDPDLLLPWLLPRQARYVGATFFRSDPPEVEGEISGIWRGRHGLQIRAQVRGTDFIYNGSHILAAESGVRLDGPILVFEDLRVERAEGELTGWVRQDLAQSKSQFDIRSQLHPHAVARMIGPASHRFAQRFRFEGPVQVHARGRVEAGPGWDNEFTAEVEGSDLGMERFLMQQAAFSLAMRGREVRIERVRGVYADGYFEGRVYFDIPAEPGEATAYDLALRIEDADLASLVSDLAREDTSVYDGRMDASLALTGRLGKGQGPTAGGRGRVHVGGVGWFGIPVLGGLSALLSRLYPGLGFLSQDEFHAGFTVADSRVSSDSMMLEGGVLSIEGRGDVFFDRRLNARVQVRLLRRGLLADVLRLITSPLTKLLEFDLGGTAADPRWRPRNFSVEALPAPD